VESSLVTHHPTNPDMPFQPRRAVLGLAVDAVTLGQALDWMAAQIEQRRATPEAARSPTAQVVTLNPEMVMAARRDDALRAAIASAALVVADGAGVVWAAGLRQRVAGVDLLTAFAERAAARGYRLFLLGAAPRVADEAARRLAARHPNLRVVGTYAGSPAPEELPGIAARVRASDADAMFVAFGSPAQEHWIAAARPSLGAAVAIGVGGGLDFVAGRVPRAPAWMRRRGLEWLYRLRRQPWRWRRMLALPRFVLAVGAERLARRWIGMRDDEE
jgi:N-acetylglucosaminyldiphosphoundecaprenol N-acetyl-beta-D-mannosaminyltransferase